MLRKEAIYFAAKWAIIMHKMHCIGVDIVEVERIERAIARWGELFLGRVYTPGELDLCRRDGSSLALRFAAKEAVIKALGGRSPGFSWREIEILSEPGGKPLVTLHGGMKARAASMGLNDIAVSLSDSREYAVAFVVADASP